MATNILLAITAAISLAILYYVLRRSMEKFVAMQEYIYIPPQMDMDVRKEIAQPTVLANGITVQTMDSMGPMCGSRGPQDSYIAGGGMGHMGPQVLYIAGGGMGQMGPQGSMGGYIGGTYDPNITPRFA